LNYDYDYSGGGFPELNWFDAGWKQMYSHFTPQPRVDADITDIDRFFGDCDPEQWNNVMSEISTAMTSGVTQKRPMRVTSKPANGNEARGR
jgi:hypothetical protein